jgi:hypothetical protein
MQNTKTWSSWKVGAFYLLRNEQWGMHVGIPETISNKPQ